MTQDEWNAGWVRCLGMQLSGKMLDEVNELGQPITDETYLLMLNPHHEPIKFYMPKTDEGNCWELVMDTRTPTPPKPRQIRAGKPYELIPWCAALMRAVDKNSQG